MALYNRVKTATLDVFYNQRVVLMSAELGKIIQASRERLGWTQDELGKNVGVSQQTIAKWEAGKSYPRPKALERLIERLKITGADVRKTPARNDAEAYFDKIASDVAGNILEDEELYPLESNQPLDIGGLPGSFPMEARLSHVANTRTLKKLLQPVVDAIEPSGKWDAVVHAPCGNLRVDYVNDELYAMLMHAPNPMVLSAHLRSNIFRILWRFATLSVTAKHEAKYQLLIITLPKDQPLDFPEDNTGRYRPPVSNSRMLRRLISEAGAHEIYIVLARTPAEVAGILANPSRYYDPGWDWPGHEWDEDPDA